MNFSGTKAKGEQANLENNEYNAVYTADVLTAVFAIKMEAWLLTMYRVGQKNGLFSDLITLWRLVLERRAVCQNFRNFIERKKVQNSHFSEFKYSLPNLLKSSQQLKLWYIYDQNTWIILNLH